MLNESKLNEKPIMTLQETNRLLDHTDDSESKQLRKNLFDEITFDEKNIPKSDDKYKQESHEEPIYVSFWEQPEKEIEYVEENHVKFHKLSDNEFGIGLCDSEHENILNPNESAILFGNDIGTLYLRASFSYIIKLNIDDDDMLNLLYKSNTVLVVINNELYHIPVYKNACDLIELNIFNTQELEIEDIKSDLAISKNSNDTNIKYDEFKKIIKNEIERYNGKILISLPEYDNFIHPFYLITLKNQYLLVVFDGKSDCVLSDEDPFDDQSPLWFTESQHFPSPIFQARNLASFIINNTKISEIYTVVLFSDDCEIINIEELKESLSLNSPKVDILKSFVSEEDKFNFLSVNDYFYSIPEGSNDLIKINNAILEQLKTEFIKNFKQYL